MKYLEVEGAERLEAVGGAVGHSGEARKTDRVARRDVAFVHLNGRSSLRPDLAGNLLRSFYWLLSSVVVA